MKKILSVLLACALVFSIVPNTSASTAITPADVPETLVFDADTSQNPIKPWPTTFLCQTARIDYPFTMEYATSLDGTGKPVNWQPLEPVTLYQWPDDSWRNAKPSDIAPNDLRMEEFYLVESGCYYRVTAKFGGRTNNISTSTATPSNYSLNNIYNGLLDAGRTGWISLELHERISDIYLIHRCKLHIASVDGAKFIPQTQAANINGDIIVTFYPSTSTDRRDYYKQTSFTLILPDNHGEPFNVRQYDILY